MAVSILNADLRLDCLPAVGGRIVSLVDRATGRDWLTHGTPPADPAAWASDEAVFGAEQAFGWDECLPTIGRCPDPVVAPGPLLRDHGDAWGRPTAVETGEDGTIRAQWRTDGRFELTRTLRLAGRTVVADYAIRSLGPEIPFLWSMHPLLALEAGSRIELPGLEQVGLSHASGIVIPTEGGAVDWPIATTADGASIDLSLVPDEGARFAVKLAARIADQGDGVVVRAADGAALRIEWDRTVAPAVGLWLDHGGWPEDEALRQVAVEPATSTDEDLATAATAGRAAVVPAGGEVRWWVAIEVSPAPGGAS